MLRRAQDPRVPEEVEEYLVNTIAAAAGPAGGARGAAVGARRLRTVIQERAGHVPPGTPEEIASRFLVAFPQAWRIAATGSILRFAVPLGRTGLQQVVVDLDFAMGTDNLGLRAYAKEGLLSRKPAATMADQAWSALAAPSPPSSPTSNPQTQALSQITEEFVGDLNQLLESSDADWLTVWARVEVASSSALTAWAGYLGARPNGGVRELESPLLDATFLRLWQSARSFGLPTWTTATLVVDRKEGGSGTFSLDYGYEPVPPEGQARRFAQWRAATLPGEHPEE